MNPAATAAVFQQHQFYTGFHFWQACLLDQLHGAKRSGMRYSNTFKFIIMEIGKILSADVLDIIFDERNKEYGAYDLRKHYQRRLTKALMVTLLLVALICLTYVLLGAMHTKKETLVIDGVIDLAAIPPKDQPMEKIIPPPQKIAPPPEVRMIKDMVPLIVTDKDVPKEEEMSPQDDIDKAKIGNMTTEGPDEGDIVKPPVDARAGITSVPQKEEDYSGIFSKVEIESTYPGGTPAWSKFLYKNLNFPQEAADINVQGTVMIQFIVDAEGKVSDVTAISGPEELRAAAVAVIKKSGQWTPAIQNGHKVKSYKRQPITFKLDAGS